MSIIKTSTSCVFCGGVVHILNDKNLKEIEATCTHCGYERFVKEGFERPFHKKKRGHGTYHVRYKNGYRTFGCFNVPITGKDVATFIHFIESDPSIDEEMCSLIRFDKEQLHAIVGKVPPLYVTTSEKQSYCGGKQYA